MPLRGGGPAPRARSGHAPTGRALRVPPVRRSPDGVTPGRPREGREGSSETPRSRHVHSPPRPLPGPTDAEAVQGLLEATTPALRIPAPLLSTGLALLLLGQISGADPTARSPETPAPAPSATALPSPSPAAATPSPVAERPSPPPPPERMGAPDPFENTTRPMPAAVYGPPSYFRTPSPGPP